MFLMLMYFLFIFFCGLYIFFSMRKHLLLVLLSLEYMVLGVFFLLFLYLNYYSFMSWFLVIFLIFSVCEGVLGLAVLVSMIRSSGSDYVCGSYIFLC